MSSWVFIEAGKSLRAEFDREFPGRDKASDGTIGNEAHAESSSDHNPDETGTTPYEDSDSINEVHAEDVDDDLRRPGVTMQMCLDIIVGRHRSGQDSRLQNIIYNRRIISRSWGWDSWHDYTGASAHTEHAHFSFRYGSGSGSSNPENRTAPWGLESIVTKDEIKDAVREVLAEKDVKGGLAQAVWDRDTIPNTAADAETNPNTKAGYALGDVRSRLIEIGETLKPAAG